MGRPRLQLPKEVKIRIINDKEILSRKCPKCDIDIEYKGKTRVYNIISSIRENKTCYKCSPGRFVKGVSSWNKNKKMSKSHCDNISKSKKGKKATYSKEYLKWLSTNGPTSKTGKDSPVIQHILRTKKITYEEYQSTISEFDKYRKIVTRITNQQDLKSLSNFDKRGRCGVDGAYQIDHIIEIKEGFINNIKPEIIGHIDNLQMIPWLENLLKNKQKQREMK